MQIRIKTTGQVMYEHELRALYPNTSGPLEALYDPILEGPQAQPTRYQIAFRDGIEEINGQWFTKYSVADMMPEARDALDAQQAASVRQDRNQRLAETDWRFRSDMDPSQAWKDYCQALRDVTNQAEFPWNIQWPSTPV